MGCGMEVKLSELKPGEEGVVVRVEGPPALRRRLMEMGIVRGTKIKMVRRAPLGDPIEYEVKGYNLSLRAEEADGVYVEVARP